VFWVKKCGLQNIFSKPQNLFSPVAEWVNASRKKYFAGRIFSFTPLTLPYTTRHT